MAEKAEVRDLRRLMSLLQAIAVVAAGPVPTCRAGEVVNEIFYNAPEVIDDLQWVEVHNTADAPIDLGGWNQIDLGDQYAPQDAEAVAALCE